MIVAVTRELDATCFMTRLSKPTVVKTEGAVDCFKSILGKLEAVVELNLYEMFVLLMTFRDRA